MPLVMNDIDEVIERAERYIEKYQGEDLKREITGLLHYAFAMGKTYGILEAAERLTNEIQVTDNFFPATPTPAKSDSNK